VSPSLQRRGDRFLGLKLAGLVAAMFAFGFALVPLYDVFCELTGYGGRTANAAAAAVPTAPDFRRTLRVEFVASVPSGAPWEFRPAVSHLEVHPGEIYETHYEARNLTGQPLTAQAVPSVAPGLAGDHFKKLECFCFTTQAFEARETRDLKVRFMVDQELPEHVDTVSLSYTLFALSK
jgi:cytochrome c oxidase assembly protein subunit 11